MDSSTTWLRQADLTLCINDLFKKESPSATNTEAFPENYADQMVGIIFSDMKIIPQTSCTCIGVIFILFFTNRREKDVCTNKNYDQKSGKETKDTTPPSMTLLLKNPYAVPSAKSVRRH